MQDNRGFSELDEARNGLSINNFVFFLGWPRFSGKLVFLKKLFWQDRWGILSVRAMGWRGEGVICND